MSKRAVSPDPAAVAPPLADSPDVSPDVSLDQVRNILFGQQVREFERKLASLEAHFQQSSTAMNQALLERIATLEKALTTRLEQETQEREIGDSSLQSSLDRAVDDLESRLASGMKEMRADLKDQGKETNKKIEQLVTRLEAALAELRLQKTDRVALADLLGGVADKLRKG